MIDRELLSRAKEAAERAYAPYSRFRVGASCRTGDGRVFTGCNVENASSGLTLCAERATIAAAVSAGCRDLRAMAVYAPGPDMPIPCGACRQVLAEFVDDIPIYISSDEEEEETTLSELFPRPFTSRCSP